MSYWSFWINNFNNCNINYVVFTRRDTRNPDNESGSLLFVSDLKPVKVLLKLLSIRRWANTLLIDLGEEMRIKPLSRCDWGGEKGGGREGGEE